MSVEAQLQSLETRFSSFETKLESKLDSITAAIQESHNTLSDKIGSLSDATNEKIYKLAMDLKDTTNQAEDNKTDLDRAHHKLSEQRKEIDKLNTAHTQFTTVKRVVFALPVLVGVLELIRRL